jgi:protoporphyrinogen oxidase
VTGLAAGLSSGCPVFEQAENPGGICASYYVRPQSGLRYFTPPEDGEAYRFELGGGHWIFGGEAATLRLLQSLVSIESYSRRAAVFFNQQRLYVPYPLQNHLGYLKKDVAAKAVAEITTASNGHPETMADWLLHHFGPTLTELFFAPFHERYTAGLWTRIIPQDPYKSPLCLDHVIEGLVRATPPAGYNVNFLYPSDGLDALAQKMAAQCRVQFGKRVVEIDPAAKCLVLADGGEVPYKTLAATLPLHRLIHMTGLQMDEPPDPYTSVLVLNIGATRGPHCPDEHWLYIPDSESGFYRVGFYSNVSPSFLPRSSRTGNDRVSVYVERAYAEDGRPSDDEVKLYSRRAVQELRDWGFIGTPEVVDATWIDVAYTWSWRNSRWKTEAVRRLEQHDIHPVGRYGRWIFQGIADSIRDGLLLGKSLKA